MGKIFWRVAVFFLATLSLYCGTTYASEQAVKHSVARGESLWKLAKDYGTTVPALQKANMGRYPSLGTDPDHILVGWTLVIPPRNAATTMRPGNQPKVGRFDEGTQAQSQGKQSNLPQQEAKKRESATEGFIWRKAARDRCRLSFEDALKAMGDSQELIAQFREKAQRKDYEWVRLTRGEIYEAMCFGTRIARNVTNALPKNMPEWAYWAREYTVERDGVRYRRRDPLVCGNILKLPNERIATTTKKAESPTEHPQQPPSPEIPQTPQTVNCECGELFEVIASIGPLPRRNHRDMSEEYRKEMFYYGQ